FTGHVPAGSTGLTYHWARNGNVISGAVNSFYTTNNLQVGDTICFIAHSPVACTYPDSSIACIPLQTTGIGALGRYEGISVYPNPVDAELIIEGAENGDIAVLYNVIGQEILRKTLIENKEIVGTKSLVKGSYILEILKLDGSKEEHKIVK